MANKIAPRQFPHKIATIAGFKALYRRKTRPFRTHRKFRAIVYSFLGAAIPERQVALSSRHFKLLRAGSF